ncbi:MAG: heme exporter protein CcmB [Veillonella sp.]|nr:heme exporter protein CcmB [Veillonella sp.]
MEVRTKSSMTSFLLFSFISLFLVSLSMGSVNSNVSLPIKAALYWIIIFFSSLSTLDKAFIQEKDRNTFLALRLYVPAQAVFLGKLLYNFVLLLILE